MSVKILRANTTDTTRVERQGERGAALVLAILIMFAMAVVTMGVLATVSTENRMAGSDLNRTQTFYAAAAGIEKMTNKFSDLFARTSRPSTTQLDVIRADYPSELTAEGFTFIQHLDPDDARLAQMRSDQGIIDGSYPRVTVPNGPFAGLIASVAPYLLRSTATKTNTGTQVALEREMNNYLIPLFQFGMFSNEDLTLHPGPAFTFNGRVHANGNIYVNGNVKFLAKVTAANEFVLDVLRNGGTRTDTSVSMVVNNINVAITKGSVNNGPNVTGQTSGQRGYFPGAPGGTFNTNWESVSVAVPRSGVANQFGGQLQTRTTGAVPLLLPLQLDGNPSREIIKRTLPNDTRPENVSLKESRYHYKSQIRILLDDEGTTDAAGIPAGAGVALSTFTPEPLPAGTTSSGGGRALRRINNDGTYDSSSSIIQQQPALKSNGRDLCTNNKNPAVVAADTVRGIKIVTGADCSANDVTIPNGAGIKGRILIQIVDANGVARDVTTKILSMGMTEGEPNGIVYLQRPLWAAFTQGSRDASGGNNYLTYLMNSTTIGSDGEIKDDKNGVTPALHARGFLTNIVDDGSTRQIAPDAAGTCNSIVPINIYNVREGRINTDLDANTVYERGVMSVVEINMKNLSRWVDGVYDTNLLAGTSAVSANINGQDGYVLYVSDRRGDRVKTEKDSVGTYSATNGMVDNEDIYGPNNKLDVDTASSISGEDVIDAGIDCSTNLPKKGTLQKDTNELPDPTDPTDATKYKIVGNGGDRLDRAINVAKWTNPSDYFRRSVRLFNGEDLQNFTTAGKLSSTKGITVSTENMIYIWGNYNTEGITSIPANGAALNDGNYRGDQVPASIVADAFTPLSKTWFDSMSSLYPDDLNYRQSDYNLPTTNSIRYETSMRCGIIAGDTIGALSGSPDAGNGGTIGESRLNGGMHNFPRFLENWSGYRWNFVGALIPLYHSTQAMGPYNANSTIYGAPVRNWAFDDTFKTPSRLPPGTPVFQYIEPTGFRQVL